MSLYKRLLLARKIVLSLPKRPPLWEIVAIQLIRAWGMISLFFERLIFTDHILKEPIIIIGMPRTGTTFIHRWLHKNEVGVGRELWQILFPSRIQQWMIKPVLPFLESFSPTRHHPLSIHKSGLQEIEVDEAGILLHHFDGFFLYAFILAHAEDDLLNLVDPQMDSRLREDWRWYQQLWKEDKSPVLAKIFGCGAQVPLLLELQPDARLIYTIRDPRESIPSTLSLLRAVLNARFGFSSLPKIKQQRYYRRITKSLLMLQRRFWTDWHEHRFDRDRVFLLEHRAVKLHFEEQIQELLSWLGVDVTEELKSSILLQAKSQTTFKSKHHYALEEFGLDPLELEAQAEWIKNIRTI
ncbi:MAG: hypothetical protein CMK59_07590 [Proteobacteria bacterium]|nr:hypothetical protein [Pseudomonadota bacterium]